MRVVEDADRVTLNELMKPVPFVRQHYQTTLRRPYSRKLMRPVALYRDRMHALWAHLESDPDIAGYNESVMALPMVVDGKAVNISPAAMSLDGDGNPTVHSFAESEPAIADAAALAYCSPPWEDWARRRGFRHVAWTPETLLGARVRLSNLLRLLRFVCIAGAVPDFQLEQRLLATLADARKMTFAVLARNFPTSDVELVHASIARLILDGKVFSDIDHHPFSMITELSVHEHAWQR